MTLQTDFKSTAEGKSGKKQCKKRISVFTFFFQVAQASVPILVHSITLPGGADMFWRSLDEDFNSDDWRVRFAAVEKVRKRGNSSSRFGRLPCPKILSMGARTTYFFKLEPIHHFGWEFDSQAGGILPIIKAVPHNKGKFQLHLWKIPLPKPGGGEGSGPHTLSCWSPPFTLAGSLTREQGKASGSSHTECPP